MTPLLHTIVIIIALITAVFFCFAPIRMHQGLRTAGGVLLGCLLCYLIPSTSFGGASIADMYQELYKCQQAGTKCVADVNIRPVDENGM